MAKTTNMGGGTGRKSDRDLKVRVKTSKGRKIGSTLWLQRQLNDPYVARAKAEGMRSRAAYKLMELNERYKLLHKGMRMAEVPITYRRRSTGVSFINVEYLWRVPLGMAREMLKG